MNDASIKRVQELVGLILFLLAIVLIARSSSSFAAIPPDSSTSVQQSR